MNSDEEGLTWQIGVWNQISHLYGREVDRRFSSVVEAVINRASLEPGERVLDLGAVRKVMWPQTDGRRRFHNTTHFVVGRRGWRDA
jgi:hypothetical protein